MGGSLTEADALERLMTALGAQWMRRLADLSANDAHGESVTVHLHTDHAFGPVTLADLIAVGEALGAEANAVSVWDSRPNILEVLVDLDTPTPVERPLPLPPGRKFRR